MIFIVELGIKVSFPIIADRNGEIARKYGMISSEISTTETIRNVFIIDDKGIIRLILVYPLNIGRCIPEILRCVEALQTSELGDGATPANWIPCEPIIVAAPQTFNELENRNKEIEKNRNGMNWYLNFKNYEKCINASNNNGEEIGKR